jgi:integrase
MDRYFTQALQRAGLPTIRLHDARHTYATLMLKQGIPLKGVQTLLGHSSISVTADIYTHMDLDQERQYVAQFNEGMTGGA